MMNVVGIRTPVQGRAALGRLVQLAYTGLTLFEGGAAVLIAGFEIRGLGGDDEQTKGEKCRFENGKVAEVSHESRRKHEWLSSKIGYFGCEAPLSTC